MTLTHPEQMLLEAIKAAVRDERVEWSAPVSSEDWTKFFRLADSHKLLPVVYGAVYSCPAVKDTPIYENVHRQVIIQIAEQTVKTGEFLSLMEKLDSSGFHPLVVKGIVCRALYPTVDARISADEDILIPDAEFSACCNWLTSNGMTPMGTLSADAFEVGWRSEDTPLYIELHRSLFAPDSDAVGDLNAFFTDAHGRSAEYTVDDHQIRSLCPHDHMLYLLLHACKHFMYSGFGIRQALDIGLWAERYSCDIDWDMLYTQCEAAHADTFAAAIFALLKKYFDICPALSGKWLEYEVDPDPMLRDLLTGGIYGASDLSRLHSASVTLGAVESNRTGKRHSVLSSVFPPKSKLMRQYPELDAHPDRLPLIWARRITRYLREKRRTDNNSTSESLRIAKERTELLRYYGII